MRTATHLAKENRMALGVTSSHNGYDYYLSNAALGCAMSDVEYILESGDHIK